MMIRHIPVVIVLTITLVFSSCQKKAVVSSPKYGNDLRPQTSNGSSGSKKKSKKGGTNLKFDQAVEAYHKRVKEVDKEKAKKAKDMKKPQYSDPTYFGHKKPPIKNPPGKKKYCQECGLFH